MSAATEKRILEYVDKTLSDLEDKVWADWDNPVAAESYLKIRGEFRCALESRIRLSEWLKEPA